jgi:HTH-type transcriptional regulator/antitoxin HipB
MQTGLYQPLITPAQLGQQLLAARNAKKMSQATLAKRVGLSQSRISHLEQHASQLSVEQLMSWCSALGLEIAVGRRGGQREPGSEATAAW